MSVKTLVNPMCSRFARFSRSVTRKLKYIVFPLSALAASTIALAQGNGITVGQPKIYDNQSLTIMLDELNKRLQDVTALDPQSLEKALALTQGSQQQETTRSMSIAISPSPAAAAAPSTHAASSDSSGSDTKSSASKSSQNSSAVPDLLSNPPYKPNYGENAVDLLSDQVDLTYQIFNLRMLLERSLSDRYINGKPRRQAVVSFNITLDPPKNARDAAAYVEITLHSSRGPVSLVAAMPQEKTYNATALSSSSNAFGGSAVAKIITFSYNQQKKRQNFFLYRDCDTLAIERASDGNKITFGWVFRPVLGKRSVSPGMRQMFAVIAVPESDEPADDEKEDHGTKSPGLEVEAKTYWLHYDNATSTTIRTPRAFDWSAKNLPGVENVGLANIPELPTAAVDYSLSPVVDHVEWFPTTAGNTVVQISGKNFYTGTSVTVGDKNYSSKQEGLFIKSSQSMVLTASSDVLSHAMNAMINGRYGHAVPLYPSSTGIVIARSSLGPDGPANSMLELTIGDAEIQKDLRLAEVLQLPQPYVVLNGAAVPHPASLSETRDKILDPNNPHYYVVASVSIPNALLAGSHNWAGIVFPLHGRSWAPENLIYDSDEIQVVKMTSGSTTSLLISRPGKAFSKDWQVVLDKSYPLEDPVSYVTEPRNENPHSGTRAKKSETEVQFTSVTPCTGSSQCFILKLTADSKFLANYQKFVLVSDERHAIILDVPATTTAKAQEKPTTATAKITSLSPSAVGLNEVIAITATGSNLDSVKQVSFDGKPLTFWIASADEATPAKPTAKEDPKTQKPQHMRVLLTRAVTGKEGHQELLFESDEKHRVTATLIVAAAPTAAKGQAAPATKEP